MQDAKGAGFRLGTESTERTDEAVAAAQGAAVRRTGRGDGSRCDRPRSTGRRAARGSCGEGHDEAGQVESPGRGLLSRPDTQTYEPHSCPERERSGSCALSTKGLARKGCGGGKYVS